MAAIEVGLGFARYIIKIYVMSAVSMMQSLNVLSVSHYAVSK
jgi:hypothetical protein